MLTGCIHKLIMFVPTKANLNSSKLRDPSWGRKMAGNAFLQLAKVRPLSKSKAPTPFLSEASSQASTSSRPAITLFLKYYDDEWFLWCEEGDLLQARTASFLVIEPLSSLSISWNIRSISSSLICVNDRNIDWSSPPPLCYVNLLFFFPSERVLQQGRPLIVLHLTHHCLLRDRLTAMLMIIIRWLTMDSFE